MKVLQISVYYNRGGAGIIAKHIHDGLIEDGIASQFLYAFEKGGKQETKNNNVQGIPYLNRFTPHLNFLAHSLVGIDFFPADTKELKKIIEKCDIIHLHVIHSHTINYKQLISIINELDKKVVITCHDSWYYTGRCAIREECTLWQEGCPNCPHLDYYPSTKIDLAASEYVKKIGLFNSIKDLTFISPSKWLADDLKFVYPQKTVEIINNGIEVDYFKTVRVKNKVKTFKYLFITNDFNEDFKVNKEVLYSLENSGKELHLIGRNSPFEGKNTINHGYLSSKNQLIDILNDCDILLFFSTIDNFPTTLIEGLCSGILLSVMIVKGLEKFYQKRIIFYFFEDYDDLTSKIEKSNNKIESTSQRKENKRASIANYSKENMISQYLKIYEREY